MWSHNKMMFNNSGNQEAGCSSVARIRQFSSVSRIRYVSDTDTYRIRDGYVSSEYPNYYYFREYWISGPIRIRPEDTAQPTKKTPYLPDAQPAARPNALTSSRRISAWWRASASARGPATSLLPFSPAGRQRRVSAPAIRIQAPANSRELILFPILDLLFFFSSWPLVAWFLYSPLRLPVPILDLFYFCSADAQLVTSCCLISCMQ